jgi:ferritin-like metal-binding protein YciE
LIGAQRAGGLAGTSLHLNQGIAGNRRREGQEMPITNMQELFAHELGEIYDAEHRFLDGQVKMVHRATDSDLQSSIENHILQTRQHIGNLEQFFRELGEEPRRETNEAAQGLVSEAEQSIEEAQGDALRDCAINTAIIKVEHFEIGSYRGLITGARLMMGESVVVGNLLEANLQQEEETAQIAEQSAEELLQKAMRTEAPEQEGLADKMSRLKDRLTSQ